MTLQFSLQILFSAICIATFLFDILLLITVLKMRHLNSNPYVYVIFMTTIGLVGKISIFFMFNAYTLSQALVFSYESRNVTPLPFKIAENAAEYRNVIGKQVTLISTFAYLLPLCLNWLMTAHRMTMFLSPAKNSKIFSDNKLLAYCSGISLLVFVSLLIPYYSACSLNFDFRTNVFAAQCDPERHPITAFQNRFTVFMPVLSMSVNIGIILWLKIKRKTKTYSKLEKAIIRQAIAIAFYLSIYELGYQLIRQFPVQYSLLSLEIRTIILQFRFTIVCSINFLVYFVETRSTREIFMAHYFPKLSKIKSKSTVTVA